MDIVKAAVGFGGLVASLGELVSLPPMVSIPMIIVTISVTVNIVKK